MGIISIVTQFATTLIGWLKDKSQAKHDLDMATIQAKTQVVLSRTQANTEWELAQLNDKDKGLRWASFVLFASPLIASWISPTFGKYVQAGWAALQPWQANVLAGMSLAVFGLKTIPRLVGSTVAAVVDSLNRPQLPPPEDTTK